jgi:uroporphyrinogen decarboxylase
MPQPTPRDNLVSLYRRSGLGNVPFQFFLCPSLVAEHRRQHGDGSDYAEHFGFALRHVGQAPSIRPAFEQGRWFPGETFKPGTHFDCWGVGHEPGSDAAHHMTRMLHPLARTTGRADLDAYPFPDWDEHPSAGLVRQVEALHARGLAASCHPYNAVWEVAWYLRGMDRLVADFAEDPDFATDLLDRVTDRAVRQAQAYARAGCDLLSIGDDVGTQSRLMMSPATYRRWLKPRLARITAAAKAVNPRILVQYHSCGHVTGLIRDLIEAGVDILNPVQPESMDFAAMHREFGADLSFNGVIGTQTTMPFGTPAQVRDAVHLALRIAGPKGGLLPCPTHLLEPEVPWANIEAYVAACRDWRG